MFFFFVADFGIVVVVNVVDGALPILADPYIPTCSLKWSSGKEGVVGWWAGGMVCKFIFM